jgi:hypothetical protein
MAATDGDLLNKKSPGISAEAYPNPSRRQNGSSEFLKLLIKA